MKISKTELIRRVKEETGLGRWAIERSIATLEGKGELTFITDRSNRSRLLIDEEAVIKIINYLVPSDESP